ARPARRYSACCRRNWRSDHGGWHRASRHVRRAHLDPGGQHHRGQHHRGRYRGGTRRTAGHAAGPHHPGPQHRGSRQPAHHRRARLVAEPEAPVTRERPGLRVPEADLDELRSRLRGTRWPRPWPRQGTAGAWEGGAWEGGTDADELRRLVGYWAEGYDWRAQEAAINALPLHVASLDGTDVFYLRFDAEVAEALPIVL